MKKRNAKLLAAVTAFLFPWDLYLFTGGKGWGMTFSLGKYVNTVISTRPGVRFLEPANLGVIVADSYGNQFRAITREIAIAGAYGSLSRYSLYIWAVASALAAVALVYTVYVWSRKRGWKKREAKTVGSLFVGAGTLFVVSRFFVYDYLLVSSPNSTNWFSVPLGAVYMVFVGVMFLKGFPTKGELLGDESEVEASDEKTHEGDRDTDPVAGED